MIRSVALTVLTALAGAAMLDASGEVLLKNTFIATYKNRVTITTDFKIDDVHARPNPIGTSSQDGDLHMAGRSDAIGLPMVAELSNGRLSAVSDVEQAIHQADGTGTAVRLSGVWRLWLEHKSAEPMQQGDVVPVPTTRIRNTSSRFIRSRSSGGQASSKPSRRSRTTRIRRSTTRRRTRRRRSRGTRSRR